MTLALKCILWSIIRTKNRYTLNLWPLWPKQFLSPIFLLSYHIGIELTRTERKFESSQLEEEQKSKAFELTLGQMKTDISNLGKKYFYYVHTSQTNSQTIVLTNLICNELCPLSFHVLCPYIVDVLCRQPIKLFQVVSTSEFHEY